MSLLITPYTNSSKHPEPFEKEKNNNNKKAGKSCQIDMSSLQKSNVIV